MAVPERHGMPRFLLETAHDVGIDLEATAGLASLRFPEIDVERCDMTDDGRDVRALWSCRAPSATHLRRWARAAGLAVTSVRRLTSATQGDQR